MITPVPGIYVSEQQYALNPLQIQTGCLTAFAGITERGPLNTPVHVQNFDAFLNVFGGFDTIGVLPHSVYSYFRSGGSECLVVRVADTREARRARLKLKAQNGTVELEALSEGKWGNKLGCRVWYETEKLPSPARIDGSEGSWVDLPGAHVQKDDVIKISLFGRELYRSVGRVENERVYFCESVKLLSYGAQNPAGVKMEKTAFSVLLTCGDRRETYLHVSANPSNERYFADYITKRSTLCRVKASAGCGILKEVFFQQAFGGNDGVADLRPQDFIGFYRGPLDYAGLGCFESRDDVSLLAAPDSMWLLSISGKTREQKLDSVYAVQNALILQARSFPGRFAVLDAPVGFTGMEAFEWAKKIDTEFAAAYYPAVDILDPLERSGIKTVRIPPSGAVCGCIAATDNEKGIFFSPANAVIPGAVDVAERISDGEYEFLYSAGINLLKFFPGRGIKIWGARTLSSNPDWRYINVRRTFSRIAESIRRGTQWAVFEPNDKNLRKRLVRQVSGFLLDLWMRGYLAGSTSEQGFYVRCDEELNPPQNIDAGILTFEIGLAIVKPVEFFAVTITAEKDGASVYIQ